MPSEEASHIINDLPAAAYHSVLSLSQSGMKDLAVSPLHYWYWNVNPNRPTVEPSQEMKFGTAVHCLVLDGPTAFTQRYGKLLNEEEQDADCLFSINDLRSWFHGKTGKQPKGTRKSEVIEQVLAVDPNAKIWDLLKEQNEKEQAGKVLYASADWTRIHGCADALLNEPRIQQLLEEGEPEVSLFDVDPDTGVPLKARLDWMAPERNLDLKTFTLRRGKSVDESIADAIYYEGYYRQAYHYSIIHQRLKELRRPNPFIMGFVQSDPPFEVRIREFRPRNYDGAETNIFWQKGQIDVKYFCALWRKCMDEFGVTNPWIKPQEIDLVRDEELRGMAR